MVFGNVEVQEVFGRKILAAIQTSVGVMLLVMNIVFFVCREPL